MRPLIALAIVIAGLAALANISNPSKDAFWNSIFGTTTSTPTDKSTIRGTMSPAPTAKRTVHGTAMAASKPRMKCNVASYYADPPLLYCPELGRVVPRDAAVLKDMLVEITQGD